jgi:kinase domain protein
MRVGVWGTATAVIAVALVAGTMILHHPTDAGRQTSRSSTTWPEEQAQVAKVFPELLPAGPDDTGWDGMKCQAVANSQRLGLDCANYRQRVWVYRYNSQEDRDATANFSHNENRWVLNGVKCNAEVLLSDSGDEALLLPKEDLSEFAISVQARNAKRTLEQLPICT